MAPGPQKPFGRAAMLRCGCQVENEVVRPFAGHVEESLGIEGRDAPPFADPACANGPMPGDSRDPDALMLLQTANVAFGYASRAQDADTAAPHQSFAMTALRTAVFTKSSVCVSAASGCGCNWVMTTAATSYSGLTKNCVS